MEEQPRPIRLAYVIDSLALHGAQKALIQLVRCFSQRGYQQKVYSLNDTIHPDNRDTLLQCGADVKVIGKLQILTMVGLPRLVYDWRVWKPDIVFTMLYHGDIIGRSTAKIASVPIIVSSIRARNADKNFLYLSLARSTARWVDKVVFNSRQVIPFAIQHEGIQENQVVYIPNGVDIPLDNIDPEKTRKALGISRNTILIGSVGRLHPEKGFSYLLRAFRLVQERFRDSRLLLIGKGALRGKLTSLAKELGIVENVRFLGERTDVYELLACVNVYVQSSLFEGMSNALMEAMALRKAVVATSVGGTLELIKDSETGWFVKPEHADMLAEKICYILEHPEIAANVGAAAAERMAKEFSVEKMATAYDTLFRGLISEKLRQQR